MLYINNSLQNNDKIVMLYNDMITEQLQFAKSSKRFYSNSKNTSQKQGRTILSIVAQRPTRRRTNLGLQIVIHSWVLVSQVHV